MLVKTPQGALEPSQERLESLKDLGNHVLQGTLRTPRGSLEALQGLVKHPQDLLGSLYGLLKSTDHSRNPGSSPETHGTVSRNSYVFKDMQDKDPVSLYCVQELLPLEGPIGTP